jgi:predicted nucleotidyltransferase
MYNKEAMNELKKLLLKQFPNLIDKIILYGSRAENKENEYSDYDILLILKQEYDWKLEKALKLSSYDINIDYDILTDINIISKDELSSVKGNMPFIQEALSKGLVL